MLMDFLQAIAERHSVRQYLDKPIEGETLAALEQALRLLKHGGVVSMCIYYGRNNGYAERDALLEAVTKLDPENYTVLRTEFVNRAGEPPIAVFIIKE